jgi:hypothetical protein
MIRPNKKIKRVSFKVSQKTFGTFKTFAAPMRFVDFSKAEIVVAGTAECSGREKSKCLISPRAYQKALVP